MITLLVDKIASCENTCQDRLERNGHIGCSLIFRSARTIGVHDGIGTALNPRDAMRGDLGRARDQTLNCSYAGDGRRVEKVGAMYKVVDRSPWLPPLSWMSY